MNSARRLKLRKKRSRLVCRVRAVSGYLIPAGSRTGCGLNRVISFECICECRDEEYRFRKIEVRALEWEWVLPISLHPVFPEPTMGQITCNLTNTVLKSHIYQSQHIYSLCSKAGAGSVYFKVAGGSQTVYDLNHMRF